MNRTMFKISVVLGACLVLFMMSASATPAEAWAEDDFDYAVPVEIVGVRPDNYPIRIYIDKQENLTTVNDNFTDLRFYDNIDGSRLYHWVENALDGDYAIVWVQVLDQGDNELYLYYGGNSGAENTSNAENVFGYDAGFDTKAGWTEVDPNNHIGFSLDNGTGSQSQLELHGLHDDELAYVYHQLGSASATFRVDITYRFLSGSVTGGWLDIGSMGSGVGTFQIDGTGGAVDDDAAMNEIAEDTLTSYATTVVDDSHGRTSGGNIITTSVMYYRLTADGSDVIVEIWTNENRSGAATSTATRSQNPTDGMDYLYAVASMDYNEGGRYRYGWLDSVIYRPYLATDPTATFGAVETPPGILISAPTVDNSVVDREKTIDGSTAVTATQISVQIVISNGAENADALTDNVHLWVQDNDGNVVIDNTSPIENAVIDENTLEYTFAVYDPSNAMADASLGGFAVRITAEDNDSNVDDWGYGIVFTVDDIDDVALTQENLAGHQHKISGTANTVAGDPVTLTVGLRVDSNDGNAAALVTGAGFENTYAPSDNGTVYFELETAELDGISASLVYNFPNIVPGIVSVTASNNLIDNHRSDNAITATLITVVWEDNDGYTDELAEDFFWIAVRDAADVLIDNQAPDSVTYENENRAILTYTYDAEDNTTLAAAAMGAWDVFSEARDNWSTFGQWRDSIFTVDEYVFPLVFTPTNPYVGWDLTVSGTATRVSGTVAAVGDAEITDALHGTFSQGAGNAYSENYDIPLASPSVSVVVSIIGWDGVLDGENTQSYTPHENQQYEISIRFEENYELVDWIPDASRPITIGFVEGIAPIILSSNPENIIISTGENLAENIFVSDNGKYIRRRVLDLAGGRIIMIIVGDNTGTIGGTATGDVDEFFFFLQDLTGLYEPPNGIMSFRTWIGENLAIIHEDYWAADWKMVAWLVTGTRYQVWMRADNAALRLIGPIDAVNAIEEKTIQVKPYFSEVVIIFEEVGYAAYRVNENVIRIEYQDNLAETTYALVTIRDYAGVALQVYQPDNNWFVITYSLADPEFGYSVDLSVVHTTYGTVELSTQISTEAPEGTGGTSNVFNFPDGVTLASLGSFILMMTVALAFDATRVPLGVLSMAMVAIFCWRMGWLILPGPFDGAFTATMFLVAAVIVILTWRFRR